MATTTDNSHRINAYAEGLLAIAAAEGGVAAVEAELFAVAGAIEGSKELATTLSDPHLPATRRQQIIEDLLQGKASPTTISLVSLVVANGRAKDLSKISAALSDRAAGTRGEVVAEVRSAVALTDDQKTRLAAALAATTSQQITIRNIVDPTVLGGVVTQIGDTLLDGSVRTRLTQLRDAF
jgi:F-type H+-transporting ATPase subunit delta